MAQLLKRINESLCYTIQVDESTDVDNKAILHVFLDIFFRTIVAYWPSTEPSIKRCTCVNKQTNSETGASGRRYRNITLTCGCGWIRWWWQMFRFQFQLELGTRCRIESQRQTEGFGPSVTHGWAAQPECERSAAMVARRTLGQFVAVCPRLQLTSHTQPTSTLSRIKCERYIFIKKCVRSFIEVRHYVWLCSAYICICICVWLYNMMCKRICNVHCFVNQYQSCRTIQTNDYIPGKLYWSFWVGWLVGFMAYQPL